MLGDVVLAVVLCPQYSPRDIEDVLTKVMVTATGTLDFFALMVIVTSTSSLAALFRDTCTSSVDIVGMREGKEVVKCEGREMM